MLSSKKGKVKERENIFFCATVATWLNVIVSASDDSVCVKFVLKSEKEAREGNRRGERGRERERGERERNGIENENVFFVSQQLNHIKLPGLKIRYIDSIL